MKILVDISRTVARARLPQPTGIDRVERAYIDWALARDAVFLAGIDGAQYVLAPASVTALIAWLDGHGAAPSRDLRGFLRPQRHPRLVQAQAHVRRSALARCQTSAQLTACLRETCPDGGIYLNTGHDNLTSGVFAALTAGGVAAVTLIHDVIPLDFPAFMRAGTVEKFRAKFDAALTGQAMIFNSAATAARAEAWATTGGRDRLPTHAVLPLGIDVPSGRAAARPVEPPCFVVLGTIEPRKNHALLLDLWSRLGPGAPHLHIVGRRGWRNEPVFAWLDDNPAMGSTVFERGALSDKDVQDLLRGSRALLFPSFAEGYGLPVAEALAAGVPVISADLPALREVGGAAPDWLAPDDPEAWRQAVTDYAAPDSQRRAAQIGRLDQWSPPTWPAHFDGLENLLETIVVQPGKHG